MKCSYGSNFLLIQYTDVGTISANVWKISNCSSIIVNNSHSNYESVVRLCIIVFLVKIFVNITFAHKRKYVVLYYIYCNFSKNKKIFQNRHNES